MRPGILIPWCLFAFGASVAVAADPGDVALELRAVDRHVEAGHREEALALLLGIVRKHPESLDAQLLYQDLMRHEGRESELRRQYAERAGSSPNDPEALYLYARLLHGAPAIRLYKQAVSIRPRFAEGWIGLARAQIEAGSLRAAEASVAKALKLAPRSADARDLEGWILEQQGDAQGAEEAYRAALQNDSGYLSAYLDLAHLLARAGRIDKALAEIERAVALAPANPEVLLHRGMILAAAGRARDAARTYAQAVEKAPDDAVALALLGEAYTELSEWKLAGEAIARALKLDPTFAPALAARGYLKLKQGRAKAAIADYKHALRTDVRNPEYCFYLALAQDRADRLRDAIVYYRKACRFDCQNANYRLALGAALERRGRSREAYAAYKQAAALAPEDADAWIRCGHAAADARLPRESIEAFARARKLAPKNLEILKWMGIVYESDLRRLPEAIRLYREYIERGGRDTRVKAWLDQIAPR